MTEQWRDIKGWERLYQVSNLGRVKSLRPYNGNPNPRILKPIRDRLGYLHVRLCEGQKRKEDATVHKLVMIAFVSAYPDGYEVNHKNGDKADNRLENLEYVTRSQNHLHRVHVLGRFQKPPAVKGEAHCKAKLTEQQVINVFYLLDEGYTKTAIARLYGVTFQSIHCIVNGRNWKHITAAYLKRGGTK